MRSKLLIFVCLVVFIIIGLGGCGGSRQAMKGDTALSGAGETKVQTSPGALKPGTSERDKGVSGQNITVKPAIPAAPVSLKQIHFDFDKYLIRPEDGEILKQSFQWFKVNSGKRVRVEGNCDERGTVEYNMVLGQKRADAAKNYLVNLGVDGKLLETISYGKEKPLDAGHDEKAWAKNRRADFVPSK